MGTHSAAAVTHCCEFDVNESRGTCGKILPLSLIWPELDLFCEAARSWTPVAMRLVLADSDEEM